MTQVHMQKGRTGFDLHELLHMHVDDLAQPRRLWEYAELHVGRYSSIEAVNLGVVDWCG